MKVQGKQAHLQRITDANGNFCVLAIDHRAVFVDMLEQGLGHKPTSGDVIRAKTEIIRAVRPLASSFLLDYEYCVPNIVSPDTIGDASYMIGIEGDDYNTAGFSSNYLNPNLSVQSICAMGSDAVKLFMYYHPDAPFAKAQEGLIKRLAEECAVEEIPFLLEPVLFFIRPEGPMEQAETLMRMLKKLSAYDVDIFKINFPGDLDAFTDSQNIHICTQISQQLTVPWIILTSGCNLEQFTRQLELSHQGGCRGFAVGRTLWADYLKTGFRDSEAQQHEKTRMRLIFQSFYDIVNS